MALNKAVIEGKLRKIPTVYQLKNGKRRAIFTLRVPRDNGRGCDYIDCAAYNEDADRLQKVDLNNTIRITGRMITFPNPRGEKRSSIIVKRWEQPISPKG